MGPYAALLLQRLGATVIKVEAPTGETYRRPTARKATEAMQFSMLNAGKRSLSIDLKTDEGKRVFHDLACQADVVIQNFAPGAFERLVDVDELMRANPRLIVASGSGYGSTGPYSGIRAMDLTIQAIAGVMSTTGFEDTAPVRTGPAVVDFLGGSHLSAAIMAALIQRGRTGRGQKVEVALYDAVLPSLASNIGGWMDSDGTIPERTGNRHGGLSVAPYNAFPTADGWVAVLCLHDRHWGILCDIIGRPELAVDPALSTNAARAADIDLTDGVVEAWTRQHPTAEIVAALNDAAIPCAPVLSLQEVIDSPQTRERGMLVQHSDAERDWWVLGSPLRLTDTPAPEAPRPARLGQHSREIVGEMLGLDEDALDALVDDGVIFDETTARPPQPVRLG